MPRQQSVAAGTTIRGRNQYSDWGVMDMARERPIAAAAAAAGAAAAGLFLWTKRNQISDQLSSLGDQIGDWTNSMTSRGGEFVANRRQGRPQRPDRANLRCRRRFPIGSRANARPAHADAGAPAA